MMLAFELSIISFLSTFSLLGYALSQFASTNGVHFEVDGQTFNFAGTNIYDAAYQSPTYAQDVVNTVKANGYRVLRCWAFYEYDTANGQPPAVYFQSWAGGIPTVNTGANGLGMLDDVVSAAENASIKLILTLVNNWEDLGGMDVYVDNVVSPQAFHDLFYTNTQIAIYYQNYVSTVILRYSNSSAIFSWELANEARCSGTGPNPQSPNDCSPAVITAWADKMSTYIKSIDPNHMVSFGGEGFFNRPDTANNQYEYDGGSGQGCHLLISTPWYTLAYDKADFDAILALPNIDFGTIHTYLNPTSSYMNQTWSNQWLIDHENASTTLNKPTIHEEYGLSRSDPTYNRQTVFDAWHKIILQSESINGDMTWGSLVVDGDCPGTDVFAICKGDADEEDLVVGWNEAMNAKA